MQETREVNEEGEDLIPKDKLPTDPKELGKVLPDNKEPEPAEEPAPAEVEEPKEDPEPSEAPEPSPSAPVEKPVEPSQPAPVEGETPKEKALRLEIQRLRGVNRKEQTKEFAESVQSPAQKEDEYKILKEQGYTDEEIAKMETAIDLIATRKGYIRADRSYALTIQDTVDLFVDEHPEYKPQNDPEDVRWGRFQAILKEGTYNLSGKTPKQLKTIFGKVHEDVSKELGESVVKTNPNQVAAQRHKVAVVSHSGGTKPTPGERPKVDPSQPIGGVQFKGFDKEDFE